MVLWGGAYAWLLKARPYKRVPKGQRVVNPATGKIVRGGQPIPKLGPEWRETGWGGVEQELRRQARENNPGGGQDLSPADVGETSSWLTADGTLFESNPEAEHVSQAANALDNLKPPYGADVLGDLMRRTGIIRLRGYDDPDELNIEARTAPTDKQKQTIRSIFLHHQAKAINLELRGPGGRKWVHTLEEFERATKAVVRGGLSFLGLTASRARN
jgi:hypothetical protein